MERHTVLVVASIMGLTAGIGRAAPTVINEVRLEEFQGAGTSDTDYFELAGTPGDSLDGLSYLVIAGTSGTDGQIVSLTPLTGFTIPADGFFVAARPGFLLGTPDAEVNFAFSAGGNRTHLLVSGFSGEFGDDLDTNDDGVLDVIPWTSLLDAVGIVNNPDPESFNYKHYYGEILGYTDVGPDAADPAGPLHVFRDPDATGPWTIGPAAPAGLEGLDTPGAPNDGEVEPPAIPLPPTAFAALPILVSAFGARLIRQRHRRST